MSSGIELYKSKKVYSKNFNKSELIPAFANFRAFPASVTVSRLKKAKEIIDTFELGGNIFIHCSKYEQFMVTDVLGKELFRNISLAMIAVFLCTEIVLCNLLGSIIVSTIVFIGLLGVCGYWFFLGMHLETVSTLFISVAQGITVDYSAHIVHCFLKTEGTSKEDRVKKSMITIGPAVFNAAVSTFAGFSMCVLAPQFAWPVLVRHATG